MGSVGRAHRLAVLVWSGLALAWGGHASAGALSGRAASTPPRGCALGIAGPALQPATSVREARDAAFAALAAERLPVHVTSELHLDGGRVRELDDERVSGVLEGAFVAGLRARGGGRVDALVCGPEHDADDVDASWRWPRGLGDARGCAVGVAGVDVHPAMRRRHARRDAREMLARVQATRVEHTLLLHGGTRVARAHVVGATREARRRVEDAGDALIESLWLDRDGIGPLARPGVLYLELCLPAA